MPENINSLSGNLRAIGDRIIVTDMYFGEQRTAGGIFIPNDDGKTRGIYPRWGKVYSKGPSNTDEYTVGDWVLIEHGRWTRSITVKVDGVDKEMRMIDPDGIIGYSDKKPDDVYIGSEYKDGDSFAPDEFLNK